MEIISHRGQWNSIDQKNTEQAFIKSLKNNYGIETDLRDHNEDIVISHDFPNKNSMKFIDFLEIYSKHNKSSTLALNIKSNGLQTKLKKYLDIYKIKDYFVFDMSIPDTIPYISKNMNVFSRLSEYEEICCFQEDIKGIWIDEFNSHWITPELLRKFLNLDKSICIVSPELHNRSYKKEWHNYREFERKYGRNKLSICTDHPEEARIFFND